METDKFYQLVKQLRQVQTWNENHHQTVESIIEQWGIEFLVDSELIQYDSRPKTNLENSGTFGSLSELYCSN